MWQHVPVCPTTVGLRSKKSPSEAIETLTTLVPPKGYLGQAVHQGSTAFGAEDGIRTRDPHLGKVVISSA
jgi:hypothetical protein